MPAFDRPPRLARFNNFELDLQTGELRQNGREPIRLRDQSLQILLALLERPGEVVLREELRKRLWPNDTIVEFEHSISAAMNKLRHALGDSADKPRFVETFARRGYRWITAVEWVEGAHRNTLAPQVSIAVAQGTRQSLIGKKVSHYRILEVLGGGGMGVVYKAEDLKLGRCVALKFLGEELIGDHRALERFEREARAASALNHPHICTIYEFGDYEGQPFIVMELLEGQTLRELISAAGQGKPPLELSKLLDLAVQITDGLHAAHRLGIIHRDIKPANLFVTSQGQAKILDFGLAKLASLIGPPQDLPVLHQGNDEKDVQRATEKILPMTTPDTFLSLTGVAMGTVGYMSPEQVRGEKLDPRTDLFSFGLVLYEMATGQRAFRGTTAMQVNEAILHDTPTPARELNAELPANLRAIIDKALQKDREMRYRHAAEMRELLADLVASDRKAPKSLSPNRFLGIGWPTARLVAGAILALAIILIAGVEVYRWRARSHEIIHAAGTLVPPQVAGLPPIDRGKYVAVLPFNEHDDSVRFGYVADTLASSLIRRLNNVEGISVADAGPVNGPGKQGSLLETARKLAANLIVSGTVHEAGDSVNVRVTLDDVVDSKRLWTGEFLDSPLALLSLEDQIYVKLLDALQVKNRDELAQKLGHPTKDPGAYDLYLRGLSSLQGNAYQAAMRLFDEATMKDPGFGLAYISMANCSLSIFEQNKKDKSSLKQALHYATLAKQVIPDSAEVHFTLASVYEKTGQSKKSIPELKHALELAPNSDEGYRRLGNAYLGADQNDQGIQALEKAVELNPYYSVNLNALGNGYRHVGSYDKALKYYQQVTQLEPQNPIGFANLGIVYMSMGRYQDSIAPLETAVKLDPHPAVMTNLGASYFCLNRYGDAVKQFEKAVDLSPNDETMISNLGDGYRAAGQVDKAMVTYDKAIAVALKALQRNPRSAATMGEVALCYAKKGDSKAALKYIRRARSIDPKSVDLSLTEVEIDTLTDHMAEASVALAEAIGLGLSREAFVSDPELRALRNSPELEPLLKQFDDSKK